MPIAERAVAVLAAPTASGTVHAEMLQAIRVSSQ
jgi:hypothetical protein